ncbi:hypothetical protein B7P43_G11861 [Cryptotermes secundus]|uniref:BZIP domain-containing protein n=1 Tax=Cryptotermes secundus TaxID=105785 RepID=A0A2J7QKS2_9NEOP|nr:uncharacterized protein LOC111866895 isoform X2 [Cryptotermes secundus]PNF29168.1 hypothetical protein B7P43_G11861 [Cryptotermes secundus]PNF29169.1 hypothetical protein B7P43_G11861 [Cryptotermes secundus]
MLGEDGPMWAISHINDMGVLNSSWKEEKSSNCFQEVQNGIGYVDPPEESTWSKSLDSAASVFPPSTLIPTLDLDIWGEIYQGVSSLCPKPLQDTSSTMVGDRKGSNCIVQDDELNTPETGVEPKFDLTSPPGVMDTSPFLSDGEGWEISAPLNLLQMFSVEEDKSVITVKKSDSDNTQCKPANEFFVDETLRLSVSHEEERVSSHNQEGLNHEGFVAEEESHNTKTSVNAYELEHGVKVMDFGSCESASKASLIPFNETGTSENTNIRIQSLGSLLGPNFNVMPVDNGIFSVHINQQQAETNLSLKNLLSGSIYHSDTNVGDQIRTADETCRVDRITNDVMNTAILAKSHVASPMKADTHLQIVESDKTCRESGETGTAASMLRTDVCLKMGEQPKPVNYKERETAMLTEVLANGLPTVNSEPSVLMGMTSEVAGGDVHVLGGPQSAAKEGNIANRGLKLDLATPLGTDEMISTPVILESLLKQDEPFDLVSYVFDKLVPGTTLPTGVELVAETSGTQRNDAELECMEAERECNQFSSSLELLRKPNQQFEEGKQTNVRRGLEGKEDRHFLKARRSRKASEPRPSFESTLSQDGPTLKLKISRTKPATSTKVLSSRKLSPRVNICELEDLLLLKETRGCPEKRVYPSTSKANISSRSRSRQRKLSTSVADESWTPPSKRSRMPSVNHISDRYRELRDRNNEASRKSRKNRKAREGEMKELATKLEEENESLKISVDELEELVKKLREALLEAVVKMKTV